MAQKAGPQKAAPKKPVWKVQPAPTKAPLNTTPQNPFQAVSRNFMTNSGSEDGLAKPAPVKISLVSVAPQKDEKPVYTITTPPEHGVLTGTVPSLTYTPNPGFEGTDTFQFTISGGKSKPSEGTMGIVCRMAPRLDLLVRHPASSDWIGDDVYSWDGALQAARQEKTNGEKAIYFLKVQSQGTLDQYSDEKGFKVRLRGVAGKENWQARYWIGEQEVTTAITADAGHTTTLNSGKDLDLRVEVTGTFKEAEPVVVVATPLTAVKGQEVELDRERDAVQLISNTTAPQSEYTGAQPDVFLGSNNDGSPHIIETDLGRGLWSKGAPSTYNMVTTELVSHTFTVCIRNLGVEAKEYQCSINKPALGWGVILKQGQMRSDTTVVPLEEKPDGTLTWTTAKVEPRMTAWYRLVTTSAKGADLKWKTVLRAVAGDQEDQIQINHSNNFIASIEYSINSDRFLPFTGKSLIVTSGDCVTFRATPTGLWPTRPVPMPEWINYSGVRYPGTSVTLQFSKPTAENERRIITIRCGNTVEIPVKILPDTR